ncbi:MAG: recombinase family protein [Oscillospiraceae bacterium]|nr:recombinase family protein [Oscillospiraceae bacterium]
MIGQKYALIRVSTKDQNTERQIIRMKELGVPMENILIEKESGKSPERKAYHCFTKQLKMNDILYIENIDRLSRDYDGILDEWYKLTRQIGVIIKVLDTPLIDTDQADNSLFGRFIRNIMLHILSFQADYEWQIRKKRQAQGIAVAQANGKQFGRAKSVITEEEINIVNQYQSGQISLNTALKLSGRKKSAFYNLCSAVSEIQEKEVI